MKTLDAMELADFLGESSTVASPSPSSDPLSCLDGLAEAQPASTGKAYPQYPDPDGTGATLAKRALELADAADEQKTNNKLIGDLVTGFYYRHWHGKPEPMSSVRVICDAGPILVTFKKAAKTLTRPALDPVRHILGPHEPTLFRDAFEIKVDGDEVPAAAIAPLVAELKTVFARHGATKALSVKRQYKPTENFFTRRHTLFTPEQNLELNRTIQVTTSVKARDVK